MPVNKILPGCLAAVLSALLVSPDTSAFDFSDYQAARERLQPNSSANFAVPFVSGNEKNSSGVFSSYGNAGSGGSPSSDYYQTVSSLNTSSPGRNFPSAPAVPTTSSVFGRSEQSFFSPSQSSGSRSETGSVAAGGVPPTSGQKTVQPAVSSLSLNSSTSCNGFPASNASSTFSFPARATIVSLPSADSVKSAPSGFDFPSRPDIFSVLSSSLSPEAEKQSGGRDSSYPVSSAFSPVSLSLPVSTENRAETQVSGKNFIVQENVNSGPIKSATRIVMEDGKYNSGVRSSGIRDFDFSSVISTPGGPEREPFGGQLNSNVSVNGESFEYSSYYVKNVQVSAGISGGETSRNVNYGPAVYYWIRDARGRTVYDERTLALSDGDGKEFIHPIEGMPVFADLDAANAYTSGRMTYVDDTVLYGINPGEDAWANPAEALSRKERDFDGDGIISANERGYFGDCEEFAFVLASLGRFHLESNLGPSEIYVGNSTWRMPNNRIGSHLNVARNNDNVYTYYEPIGGFSRDYLYPEETYHFFFNDHTLIY